MKELTPWQIIQAECEECAGGDERTIRECAIQTCGNWSYRIGTRPHPSTKEPEGLPPSRKELAIMADRKITVKVLPPLKAIRAKCKECSGGELKQVRECPVTACWIWPYRMGRRPQTAK